VSHPNPDVLRARARALRSLAHSLSTGTARTVDRSAQSDTWLGPTATRCADDLARLRVRLDDAERHLRDRASHLDRLADAAERAAAVARAGVR
jgi:hypothetical protein